MKRIQEMVRQQPGNPWVIYSACKMLEDELRPLSHAERAAFLSKKLPGATREAISEGLAEFESVTRSA